MNTQMTNTQMMALKISSALLLGAFTLNATQPNAVVAHEWGTFTSVAKADGAPVSWAPLSGPGDLPCFVAHLDSANTKYELSGLVRMETPVLYFYAAHPTTLSVHVDFPHGWITEWYPKADVARGGAYVNGKIDWNSVEVLPQGSAEFPVPKNPSRYLAARNTDAAALRVGDQQEKFLFYRGLGGFQVPLRPKYVGEGKLEIRNTGPDPIPLAIVFENHAGKIGYRFAGSVVGAITVDAPEMTGDLQQLRVDLARRLTEFGLHQREADAMVETWRDSWFEEGTRVLYVYPQAQINTLLPLSIQPSPASIARVFVGRVEVLSPWTRETIQTALDAGDVATLRKFGRFLEPFLKQMPQINPSSNQPAINALQKLQAERNLQASCVN